MIVSNWARALVNALLMALAFASAGTMVAQAAPAKHVSAAHVGALPRGRDWSAAVAVVAGGHTIGNPAAKAKLVEYISYTCPHCAHFNQVTQGPLRLGYVRPGRVQVEIRSLVRDPIDLTVAMLVNCGDPRRFLASHDLFLASQDRWMGVVSASSEDQRKRWDTGPLPTRLKTLAEDLGFYPMMAGRGYTRAQVDACLADKAMLQRLIAQTEGAEKAGVNSTPSFLVNGALTSAHDWVSLEPLIKAAS